MFERKAIRGLQLAEYGAHRDERHSKPKILNSRFNFKSTYFAMSHGYTTQERNDI